MDDVAVDPIDLDPMDLDDVAMDPMDLDPMDLDDVVMDIVARGSKPLLPARSMLEGWSAKKNGFSSVAILA